MEKSSNKSLYLMHHFEEKPLVSEFIANTMLGIEYLWGGPVQLETSEIIPTSTSQGQNALPGSLSPIKAEDTEPDVKWQRVLYTMEKRKLSKKII
jgi:stage V sporulation protein R